MFQRVLMPRRHRYALFDCNCWAVRITICDERAGIANREYYGTCKRMPWLLPEKGEKITL